MQSTFKATIFWNISVWYLEEKQMWKGLDSQSKWRRQDEAQWLEET